MGDFLSKNINKPIPLSTPQWRMWFYENYSEEESVIFFKEHHVMADGLGILEIILLMTDKFNSDAVIDFRPTTLFKQIVLYMISPLFIFYYLFPIIFKRSDKFMITNVPLSGNKKVACGKKFLLKDMKRSAKDLGVSINDLAAGALSRGLTEYLEEIGDTQKGPMTAMIPVNLRTKKAMKPNDIKLQN